MKKLIFILLMLPIGLMAQKNSLTDGTREIVIAYNVTPVKITSFNEVQLSPTPPASATITITITDTGTATLVDIRDTLCAAWGYGGNPTDGAAKLAFLKQVLINKIVNDNAKTIQLVQNIQVSVN